MHMDELSEIDALRLENLYMKAMQAKLASEQTGAAWVAALKEAAARYDFDPSSATLFFDTRKIVRK
jgi:hypothetical protein